MKYTLSLLFNTLFCLSSILSTPALATSTPRYEGFSKMGTKLLNSFSTVHDLARHIATLDLSKSKEISKKLLSMKDEKLPKFRLRKNTLHFKYHKTKYVFKHLKENTFLLNKEEISFTSNTGKISSNILFNNIFSILFTSTNAEAAAPIYWLIWGAAFIFLGCTSGAVSKFFSNKETWTYKRVQSTTRFERKLNTMIKNGLHSAGCSVNASEVPTYQSLNYANGITQYCDSLAQKVITQAARSPESRQPLLPDGTVNEQFLYKLTEEAPTYGIGYQNSELINNVDFLSCNQDHCTEANSTALKYSDLGSQDQEIMNSFFTDRRAVAHCVTQSLYQLDSNSSSPLSEGVIE